MKLTDPIQTLTSKTKVSKLAGWVSTAEMKILGNRNEIGKGLRRW